MRITVAYGGLGVYYSGALAGGGVRYVKRYSPWGAHGCMFGP